VQRIIFPEHTRHRKNALFYGSYGLKPYVSPLISDLDSDTKETDIPLKV